MKRILKLFVLASTILLSGCNLLPTASTQPSASQSSSEQQTTTQQNTTTTATESSAVTIPSVVSSGTSSEESHHCAFNLYGSYLPFTNAGIHIDDNASNMEHKAALVNSINTQAGFEILSSLSANNCTINTDNSSASAVDHLHLTVGSGGASGFLKFTFSKDITKIVVSCRAYSKTSGTTDTNAKIIIDNEEHYLPTETGVDIQPLQTYTKEYSKPQKLIQIANDDEHQRFFLESIELFY